MFQSLFCWIHGLRPLAKGLKAEMTAAVSILVLLDSWAKTEELQEKDLAGGEFQSLFCWIHGLRPVNLNIDNSLLICFNPCFVGFMG